MVWSWGCQEWWDPLFLRYGIDPPDLPTHCDGCNVEFSNCNALYWKNMVLVTNFHNKLRYGVVNLAGKAFTPSCVCGDPLINKVAPCGRARPIQHVPFPEINLHLMISTRRRGICWYATSVREERKLFTTCVLWTLTPYLTRTIRRRFASWQR